MLLGHKTTINKQTVAVEHQYYPVAALFLCCATRGRGESMWWWAVSGDPIIDVASLINTHLRTPACHSMYRMCVWVWGWGVGGMNLPMIPWFYAKSAIKFTTMTMFFKKYCEMVKSVHHFTYLCGLPPLPFLLSPCHTKLVLTLFFRTDSNCVQTFWT